MSNNTPSVERKCTLINRRTFSLSLNTPRHKLRMKITKNATPYKRANNECSKKMNKEIISDPERIKLPFALPNLLKNTTKNNNLINKTDEINLNIEGVGIGKDRTRSSESQNQGVKRICTSYAKSREAQALTRISNS